jgi:hypothetical protein
MDQALAKCIEWESGKIFIARLLLKMFFAWLLLFRGEEAGVLNEKRQQISTCAKKTRRIGH